MAESLTDVRIGRAAVSLSHIPQSLGRSRVPSYAPMRRGFHIRVYNSHLSVCEREIPRWRADVIADLAPRIARPRPARADWLIYANASNTPPHLCAHLFRRTSRIPALHALCSAPVSATWPYLFRDTNLIFGLELAYLIWRVYKIGS